MTLDWTEERRGEWPVVVRCRVLEASRAGYYAWRDRGPRATDARREGLAEQVAVIHAEVKPRYGRPRGHAALAGRGHECGVDTAARVLRAAGIAAKAARTFRRATDSNHAPPVAGNVLDRAFDPEAPNTSRVAGVTDIPTREGWLYRAAVEGRFSRAVVGGSMDATTARRLVVGARGMARPRRPGGSSDLVAHSARGRQYARAHDRGRLAEEGITCRRRRRGGGWGNAPMASFFGSRKKERVRHAGDAARAEARASILGYIEAFDNRVRRHSSLGYVAPAVYERAQNPTHR